MSNQTVFKTDTPEQRLDVYTWLYFEMLLRRENNYQPYMCYALQNNGLSLYQLPELAEQKPAWVIEIRCSWAMIGDYEARFKFIEKAIQLTEYKIRNNKQ